MIAEREEVHGNRHMSIPFRPDLFKSFSIRTRRGIVLVYIFFITAFPVGEFLKKLKENSKQVNNFVFFNCV